MRMDVTAAKCCASLIKSKQRTFHLNYYVVLLIFYSKKKDPHFFCLEKRDNFVYCCLVSGRLCWRGPNGRWAAAKEKDMAKERAWYADSAVGTLLADMFEGKWSPELLAQLAQIPLAEAERGAFPGCPPSSGRKRRFRLVERVQAHKEACSFLLARPSGSGLESFLRLAADGEGLRALETMLGLGLSRMNT